MVAQADEPAHQAIHYLRFVLKVEVISTLFPVVLTLEQHVVSDDQNLMGNGENRPVVSPANCKLPVQDREISSLGVARRPSRLT